MVQSKNSTGYLYRGNSGEDKSIDCDTLENGKNYYIFN